MRLHKMLLLASAMFVVLLSASTASGADFGWIENFNVRADADPSGFRVRLAARFGVSDAKVEVILGKAKGPADAYIIFRLGEIAARPPEYVLERYKSGKRKGWGALAKSLGIKPGSREFHALKRGDDLYSDAYKGEDKGRGKGKGKGKG